MSRPIQVFPEMVAVPVIGLVQITFPSPLPMPLKLSVLCMTTSPVCQSCVIPTTAELLNHGGKFDEPVGLRAQAGWEVTKSPDKPCHPVTCGSAFVPSR